MPKYLIKQKNGIQTSFFTQDEDIFIGRIPSINDVCINDPSISRQHAQIIKKEEGYIIYDLKSLNGVYVNGAKISKELLKDEDTIRLGDIEIEVSMAEVESAQVVEEIESFEPTLIHKVLDYSEE